MILLCVFVVLLQLAACGRDVRHVTVYRNGGGWNNDVKDGVSFDFRREMWQSESAEEIATILLTLLPPLPKDYVRAAAAAASGVGGGGGKGAKLKHAPPPRILNERGKFIRRFDDMSDNDKLFVVERGEQFVWPFQRATFNVEPGRQVELIPLSNRPRVFQLKNFISNDEADELIQECIIYTFFFFFFFFFSKYKINKSLSFYS